MLYNGFIQNQGTYKFAEGFDGWSWFIKGSGTEVIAVFRSTEPVWRGWQHWEASEEDLIRAERSVMMFGGIMPARFILEDLPW